MSEIKVLAPEVVDQIAAGEVVERPAHLVKELVENAIDAGATEIEVDFAQGGRKVRVKDNGRGIEKNELKLALSRHATSKIETSSDLWEIESFGFRGEALASIAAVSRLTLISKTREQKYGFKIISNLGKRSEVEQVGSEDGTTVLVEELFANVPARLKFLKSEAAESTQIKNVLKAMALSHREVTFRIRHKDKMLFYWPAQESDIERACQILEQESMFVGFGECNGLKANVVLCSPNNTVKSSKQIWLFVQNRWVQDRSLTAAVMDGYRSLLMHGEFPIAAVYLTSPSEDIDVNIHPTKSQVKFRNSSDAFRAVSRAVRQVLEKAPWLTELLGNSSVHSALVRNSERQLKDPTPTNISFQAPEFSKTQFSQKQMTQPSPSPQPVAGGLESYEMQGSSSSSSSQPFVEPRASDDNIEADKHSKWQSLQVLGQADLTYILTQSAAALVIVDQHAAHERVLYEKLMHAWNDGPIDVQAFLVPLTVQLEEEQVESILLEKDHLEKLGLSVDQMGPTQLVIRSAPSMIKEKSIIEAIEKLANEVTERGGSFAFEKTLNHIVATMACHSAIRAGQALSIEEMKALLVQMDEYPLSSFCPHGRPVFVEYPFQKLERDFGRIV